jgi:hypothetical protein
VLVGLVLVVGIGGLGYYFLTASRSATTASETPTASDEAKAEGAAAPEGKTTAANEGAATAPGQASPDEAAASVKETGAATQAADVDEPTILLTCAPACEKLDSIMCDNKESKFINGGLVLPPGQHKCVFIAAGYVARVVRFVVKEGERSEATVKLARVQQRPTDAKQQPCGTFINPCK